MAWRCGAVLVAVMTAGFVGCGGEMGPTHECSLDQPPTSSVCDEPLRSAAEVCTQIREPEDPNCRTTVCLTRRSECLASALAEAESCAACWGCEAAEAMRGCQVDCETQFRGCLASAVNSADVERCEGLGFECGLDCGAVTAAIPAGCR